MLLATAIKAATNYNNKHGVEVKVVEETDKEYQWYADEDLVGLEQSEDFVGIVQVFPKSNNCPHCEEGKAYRVNPIIYSGNWSYDEKGETCQECDGSGKIE